MLVKSTVCQPGRGVAAHQLRIRSRHLLTADHAVVQVICEKADKTDIPAIDKKKYLVPADLTVGQVSPALAGRTRVAAVAVACKRTSPERRLSRPSR